LKFAVDSGYEGQRDYRHRHDDEQYDQQGDASSSFNGLFHI
jgi:hypothetical protein